MSATLQVSLAGALREGIARLKAASVPSGALSAELLLIHATGRDRTWLYAHPEEVLDGLVAEKYFGLIARRACGEPTQYIIGEQEFWGLEFQVTPAVLIPRPETEHLIEVALERMGPARRNQALRIADVGTGSGCLAVAAAKEFPNASITATDISLSALEVAKRNVTRHNVADRIELVESDLLRAVLESRLTTHDSRSQTESQLTSHEPRSFDLVVSNPPYIATHQAADLQPEVRDHEPSQALFAGPTGTEVYERLIHQAAAVLKPRGILALELGYGLSERVERMFDTARWRNLSITDDLASIPRVVAAERR